MLAPSQIFSGIFGWVYFLAWSISFYPQIFVNYKLKSVEGYHLDFPFLNVSGYTFYSICYTMGYFFPETTSGTNYGLGTVKIQDLIFAYHAAVLSGYTWIQCMIYKRGKNKLSLFAILYTILAWVTSIGLFLLQQVFHIVAAKPGFNIIIYIGYLKLGVTFFKYIPLVYWNYKRKSTAGFSIHAFTLDFAGGFFSVAQNLTDLYDGTTNRLNPIKTGLGVFTMIYDTMLMFQHFVLYKNKRQKIKTSSILLGEKDPNLYTSLIDDMKENSFSFDAVKKTELYDE